jgi:hypothetical protein
VRIRRVSTLYHRAVRATPRLQLLAGFLAFFVFRLALTVPRTGPVIVADEVGYLTNARVLAGGVPGQMSTAPFYHGGYSLLLAPVLALDPNPKTNYHLVLVVNALLAASLVPLVYLLLTRCFAVPSRTAVWPSLAAAAYPSVTIFTQVAMSENLLLPLLVLWLLCFGCFLQAASEPRRLAWAAGAAACTAWLWATHGRMIVAIGLAVAAFVVAAALQAERWRAALLGLAIIGVGLVGVHVLDHFLVSRNWGGHAASELGQRLSTLDSIAGVGASLRNLVGQTWYLVAAPLGVLVAAVSRPTRALVRRPSSAELVLALLLLTGIGLLVESALSFRTLDRPDMLVYGRYSEVVVPPLVALALVRLRERRYPVVAVLATIAVVTVAAAVLRAGAHPPGLTNRWNVASLPAPTFTLGPGVLLLGGVVAATATLAIAAVGRRTRAAIAPLVLVLFLPTTAVVERKPVLKAQSTFYPSGWTSPAGAAGGARSIAFDTDHGGGLYVDQWFVSRARFVLFAGSSAPPPARLVFSSRMWAAKHAGLHPTPIWADRGRDRELFRLRPGQSR